MRMLSVLIFLSALIVTDSVAEGSPSETVRRFCQKDFEGVRLSSKTWSQIVPLITWEHGQGWDDVVAISGFKILSEEIYDDKAMVEVEFHHKSGTTTKQINLSYQAEEGTWKILPPIYQPHVSQVILCEQYARCG